MPLLTNTRLEARLPIEANIKLIRAGEVVAQFTDSKLSYTIREPGPYRLEAWLTVDGEERPWIFSNPIYATKPPEARPPSIELAATGAGQKAITYSHRDRGAAP